ncbi:MAG: dTDP-4-dehydrorhamnose 3,5-epimerase [Betaproteobacteria bacterium]
MFNFIPSKLAGCYEVQPKVIEDARGRFVKVFHAPAFAAAGLVSDFAEEYYSTSHQNVIRGMHFQLPPMDHVKMVYCIEGEVLDVVLDLRLGSPTYGQFDLFTLSATRANSVYIPKGMAHGFCALSEKVVMVYKVSTVYSPGHDAGVLWNSMSIPWPTEKPLLSERDTGFPTLEAFHSPFSL